MKTKGKINRICRVDSGYTHGWFVRIHRDGKTHSGFFSDQKYEGKANALRLAITFRDELRAKLGPPASGAYRVVGSNPNNRSGVVGVSRTKRKYVSGKVSHFFTVSWRPEPNSPQIKSFSIDEYGEKGAFQLAVKFRKDREAEISAKRAKLIAEL